MTVYACSFLEKDFPHIALYSRIGEQLITMDLSEQAIREMGLAAEMIAKKICTSEGLSSLIETEDGKYVSQNARVNSMHYDKKLIDKNIFYDFKDIVVARNKLTHPDEDEPIKDYSSKAKKIHKKLYEISIWFCSKYGCKCDVEDKKYPGIIYSEEPVVDESICACAAPVEQLPPSEFVSANKIDTPIVERHKCSMKMELTDFNKVEKEKVKVFDPKKARQLYNREFLQDIKRLSKRAEKEDLDQLTEVVKAMNIELKHSRRRIANPILIREMETLEEDLSSMSNEDTALISSRIAKTAAKISLF